MKDERLQIKDIISHIDDATLGILNVPEFQRKFIWRPSKVSDLVDSLWRGYPIGTILLWESSYDSPKTALGNQNHKLWIVDGQQRITSLSLLFGKKPYWWSDADQWNKYYNRYEVLVNISKDKRDLEFGLSNPVRSKSHEWLSVREILNSNNLSELAMNVCNNLGNNDLFVEIHEKIQSIKNIETRQIFEIIIDHELEDVAEIFSRLNTAGTKIRESDIVIAIVASKQKGWIRDKFDPFLKDLEIKGFELDPGVIVRTFSIIGNGSPRLRDVSQQFWESSNQFDKNWQKTKEAINAIIKNFGEFGILSSDILPSLNALIPIFVLKATFPKDFNFRKTLHWFLLATRDGRYSGSAITVLDQDTRLIKEKSSFIEAIDELIKRLSAPRDFKKENFLEDYSDKFLRLILYLTIFNNRSKDWIHQDVRIGFHREDNELNEGFNPEWHHFFPRKILKDRFENGLVDSIANIVVLNDKANRAFSGKSPLEYLREYDVKRERLDEQAIPSEQYLKVDKFDEFLNLRAKNLALKTTEFLKSLSQ